MSKRDESKGLLELLGNNEVLSKISPEYKELTLDIQEIMEHSKNPMFIGVLLFKLAQEREKTNQMLAKLNEKYDNIMLKLKTGSPVQEMPIAPAQAMASQFSGESTVPLKALPEQDQLIVHLAFQKGQVSAEEVRKELGYKGRNAASQRLNKLVREGHLKKIQAGRKVVFLAMEI